MGLPRWRCSGLDKQARRRSRWRSDEPAPASTSTSSHPRSARASRSPRPSCPPTRRSSSFSTRCTACPGSSPCCAGSSTNHGAKGAGTGFILLGSAELDRLAQSGETLAGRIAYTLWLRGGIPESFVARSDAASLRWRQNFIRSYLERDIPRFGPRLPVETLRRLWTMLAHLQGRPLKVADLARGLGIDVRTNGRYLGLLVDLLLVRRLPPWHANVGKRLVRSPKIYVRDGGSSTRFSTSGTWTRCSGIPSSAPASRGSSSRTSLRHVPARRRVISIQRRAAPRSISPSSGAGPRTLPS